MNKIMSIKFIVQNYFLQFTVFVTLKCTPDLIINVFSSALLYTMFVIKYISFSINIEIVSKVIYYI